MRVRVGSYGGAGCLKMNLSYSCQFVAAGRLLAGGALTFDSPQIHSYGLGVKRSPDRGTPNRLIYKEQGKTNGWDSVEIVEII